MMLLKAGSSSPSNQIVTLGGETGDRPANSRVRTHRKSMRSGEGLKTRLRRVSRPNDKVRAIFLAVSSRYRCRADHSPWRPRENIGPEIVDEKMD